LFIIEISIPFGRTTNELTENSLKIADNKKRVKYTHLIENIKHKLAKVSDFKHRYEVMLKTIIVPSLGAIPNFTTHNFASIIGEKKKKCSTMNEKNGNGSFERKL
jgi:hypothetical protein